MYHIICMNCSKEHTAKRANSKFCSDTCRDKFNKKNRGHKQECSFCRKEFKHYEIRQFCSFECSTNKKKKDKAIRKLLNIISLKINCRHCGKAFVKTTHDNLFCSKKCSQISYSKSKKIKKTKTKNCKECGSSFETSDTRLQCCSKECSNRANWRNAYLVRKRKAKENGDFHRDISVKGIIERDGDECYLCGERVDGKSHYTSKYYPTIEHVIPISKGGTHTWDNVKLAHRICNMHKHAKILDS